MFQQLFSSRVTNYIQRSYLSINASPLIESCWQCSREIDRNESTTHCPCEKRVPLPLKSNIDYFRIFHLPRSFELDTRQLTKLFRSRMKLLHPDLFTTKSNKEKKYSQDQSSLLNEAYKTLLSPLNRAHYLLKLENLTLEESPVQMDPEFLMRIMEINEKLGENVQTFPTDIAIEMRQEMDDHMKQLSEALNQMDMNKAKEILARVQYFHNINEKLTELEVKFGIV